MDLESVQLTPEEASLAKQNIETPAPSDGGEDLFRSLDAKGLFDFSVANKDFSLINRFNQRQDLWGDPQVVQKVADANEMLKERGFTFSDLPGPKEAAKGVGHFVKGAWDWAKGAATAFTAPLVDVAGTLTGQPPGFSEEVKKQGIRGAAESLAGTESALFGMMNLPAKAARKAGRWVGIKPGNEAERVKALWDEVGRTQAAEDIVAGRGGLVSGVEKGAQAAGGAPAQESTVLQDLAATGEGVRPEIAASAAAGDPAAFALFGRAFGLAGRAVPEIVPRALEGAARVAGQKTAQLAGRAVEAVGKGIEKAGEASALVVPKIITLTGGIAGMTKGGLPGALVGAAGGQLLKGSVRRTGEAIARSGATLEDIGAQMASGQVALGAKGSLAQVGRDVAESVPGALLDIGEGAAFDIGLGAATAERPEETRATAALGTVLGVGKAGLRTLWHTTSGQVAAPRDWGSGQAIPTKKSTFAPLAQMHNSAIAQATPGVKARVAAILKLLNRTDSEFYLADSTEGMAKALEQLGVPPEQAAVAAEQNGLYTGSLVAPDGTPRRVVIARNIEAAPHEAKHAVQDILGEHANRQVDRLVMQEYLPIWDNVGNEYAAALLGVPLKQFVESGRNWRDVVATESGWANAALAERIYSNLASRQAEFTGEVPTGKTAQTLRDLAAGIWDEARQTGNPIEVLIPDVAQREQFIREIGDRYLAREVAAENFDAAFKNLGESLQRNDLIGKLANVATRSLQFFGIEPAGYRRSAIRKLPLKANVMEAVTEATAPLIAPKEVPAGPPKPASTAEAEQVRARIQEAPTGILARDSAAQTIAQAMETGQGVQVSYWGAKGEPGGDPAALRPERRAEIEAQRDVPNADRQLVTKHFFPFKAVVNSKGVQFIGWSPNNFNANVARFTDWLQRAENTQPGITASLGLPYDLRTTEGQRALQNDVNTFVQNQTSGYTGSGRPVVVPKELEAQGFRAPETTGLPADLPQERADIINYFFNSKLPETTRIAQKGYPLNIAGQKVARATAPELAASRIVEPVRPRGQYAGERAEVLGVSGERVQEVNPFRQKVEQIAKDTGEAVPQLIEATQRLNLQRLADATAAPEMPVFQANTLTLQAGFQPREWEVSGTDSRAQRKTVRVIANDMAQARTLATRQGITRVERAAPTVTPQAELQVGFQPREWEVTGTDSSARKKVVRVTANDMAQARNLAAKQGITRIEKTTTVLPLDREMQVAFQPTSLVNHPREDIIAVDTVEKWFSLLPGGKGTRGSAELARQIKTPEEVERLWQYRNEHVRNVNDTLADKSIPILRRAELMAVEGAKAQFYREAVEAATGQGSGATLLKDLFNEEPGVPGYKLDHTKDPDYEPGRPPIVTQAQPREWEVTGTDSSARKKTVRVTANDMAQARNLATKQGITRIEKTTTVMPLDKEIQVALQPKQPEISDAESLWRDTEEMPRTLPAPTPPKESAALTDSGRAVEEQGFVVKHVGSPMMRSVVLFKDGSPIGEIESSAFRGDPKTTSVASIRVDREFQQQGLGETLYRELLAQLQDDGVTSIKGSIIHEAPIRIREAIFGPGKTRYVGPEKRLSAEEAISGIELARRGDEGAGFVSATSKITPEMEFAPKTGEDQDWQMSKITGVGRKKAWILPDGTPVQLGGMWHHEWLLRNKPVAAHYQMKLPSTSSQTGPEVEAIRRQALERGFVRLDFDVISKTLTVEGRAKDWDKQKEAVYQFVESNQNDIDNMRVTLFNENAKKVVDSGFAQLFTADNKLEALPLITAEGEVTKFSAQAQPKALADAGFEKELEKIRAGTLEGQIFAASGEAWTPKDTKVDLVSLASVNVPLKNLTKEAVVEALGDYAPLLEEPNVVADVLRVKKGDEEMASVDVKAVIPQGFRENTKEFAKDNNQASLWDADTAEEVKTGGTGESRLTKLSELYAALDALSQGRRVDVEKLLREYGQSPKQETFETLPAATGRPYDKAAIANMTRAELEAHFPEAVIPRKKGGAEQMLRSEITESPLFKQAKTREEAVKVFANKLVEYVKPFQETPAYKEGIRWYKDFTPRLRKAFGPDSRMFAELLAATSPQTGPTVNFKYAVDALLSLKAGRFDKIIPKFNEGMQKIADGSWEAWINQEIAEGKVADPPKEPSPATFLAHWIAKYNLKPLQSNGKLYGQHSLPVLQVFTQRWLTMNAGPKTRNFVENLLGISSRATIDLWADRTMRRLGYEGFKERWRILPKNQAGVTEVDFAFSQDVFDAAAKQLGVDASDLQAGVWFVEKVNWANNGWGALDLGDYRKELTKLPALKQEFQERISAPQSEQLKLVQPRNL